jgi:hypothetical protein
MRTLLLSIVVLACACGASNREAAKAKTARYQGDKLVLFAAAKDVVASNHQLAVSDETTLKMQTRPRWYTPEGLAANFDGADVQLLQDKSLNISLVVQLLPEADNWIVHVEPIIFRYNRGMPNPEPLKPTNYDIPGWATGKVDQLAFEINKALKQYEVQRPGGIAPPSDEPPPAAPVPENERPAPEAEELTTEESQ